MQIGNAHLDISLPLSLPWSHLAPSKADLSPVFLVTKYLSASLCLPTINSNKSP